MATSPFPSSVAELTSRFDSLVRESLPEVARNEAHLLDGVLDANSAPIVIYGFGDIGRRLLAGLTKLGMTTSAILDQRLARTQDKVAGIPCRTIEDGCENLDRRAVVIVSVFNQSGDRSFADIRAKLQRKGVENVVYFMPVFWRYPEVFLPHYCFDLPSQLASSATGLLEVFRSLCDDASRTSLAFHLYQLVSPAPALTLPAMQPNDTYFPSDLIDFSPREAFLDGGAYDGITLRRFLSRCQRGFASYLGVEPDPGNFAKLQNTVEMLRPTAAGRLETRCCAIGREHGEVSFSAAGTISSAANAAGNLRVPMLPLVDLAESFQPTFIKLDIEGDELGTLEGSMAYLQQARPKLAVCLYHRQNHFWEIPHRISQNLAGYRLYARRHREHLDDFVLYALP